MSKYKTEKITASYPDLDPLLGKNKARPLRRKRYLEIRWQLTCLEYEMLDREHDTLKLKVSGLMEEEAKFCDRSAANVSFWKFEKLYTKLEIRRLKSKAKQLEKQLKRFQREVPIPFPVT